MTHSPSARSPRVSRKRAQFLLAAPALAAVAAPTAYADIVYTPVNMPSGVVVSYPQTLNFSIVTPTVQVGSYLPGSYLRIYFSTVVETKPRFNSAGSTYSWILNDDPEVVGRLAAGEMIDDTGSFASEGGGFFTEFESDGPWDGGATGYVGLRFESGGTRYGWAELAYVDAGVSSTMTLLGFAYEDSGAGILAGAVPEPAMAALMAAMTAGSAAAFAARRKRKLAKAA